jgi:hypothetical protein
MSKLEGDVKQLSFSMVGGAGILFFPRKMMLQVNIHR